MFILCKFIALIIIQLIMSNSQFIQPHTRQQQNYELNQDNLVPVYILEDKLKQNFKKTNQFIHTTRSNNHKIMEHIKALEKNQEQMKKNFQYKMIETEKKIVQEISLQLQGRIAIAIGKSIGSFTEKLDKKEKQMDNISADFDKKLSSMKKNLGYQISQDNQKFFLKQNKKFDDKLKQLTKNMKKSVNKVEQPKISQGKIIKSNQEVITSSQNQAIINSSQNQENWQAQHHVIKQLQVRVQQLEDFSVNVDKRSYNSMTSLKESWKQLGTQLLQHKKSLNKKFDELRIDFIKLKNLKDLSIAPDKIQDEFKKKLAQKFTDIYQLLSITLTKNQFETTVERYGQRITRHDDQFLQMRKQFAANNQYFTFYANNSNQDDLKRTIVELEEKVDEEKSLTRQKLHKSQQQNTKRLSQITAAQQRIKKVKQFLDQKAAHIDKMRQTVSLVDGRITSLQDFNKFGPDKLQKIHSSLDMNFTADQQELINNKTKKSSQQAQKQFKIQLGKLKDQLFVLNSQNQVREDEANQMKKMYQHLEDKFTKVKVEAEEAMVSRKPWVCLSCDKQEKQKQHKKQASKRKLQPFKGFGPQKNSEKSIKISNIHPEQRFEVYQRFRQKYLSDTVKLPDIYKEKIIGQQASFHNTNS